MASIKLNQLPTAREVTNLYLYGSLSVPSDQTSSSLIREPGALVDPVEIDVNDYMAGPGRFATASKFKTIEMFMSPWMYAESSGLAPGIYTKQQVGTACLA